MSDREAFLSAVIASPDDDLPRLYFADWLDEHGEPERAELVRVQCALATGPSPRTDWCHHDLTPQPHCRGCALRSRERDLLGDPTKAPANCDKWARETYEPFDNLGWCSERFHRGFISELRLSWPDWLAHHAALLDACPIRNAKDGLVRLTTWPRANGADLPHDPEAVRDLLGLMFPGVRFELPRPRLETQDEWDRRRSAEGREI